MRNGSAVLLACLLAGCTSGDGDKPSRDSASAAGVVMSPAEFTSATKYLGIRYDSLPPKFTFVSGALISKASGTNTVGFDLDLVRTPRGDMVWLDSIVAVSTRGRPSRIVRAELKVPPVASDERLVMSTCSVDGQFDPRVVAIAVVQATATQYTSIRQAWRADASSGEFQVIPVTGIVCENAGA